MPALIRIFGLPLLVVRLALRLHLPVLPCASSPPPLNPPKTRFSPLLTFDLIELTLVAVQLLCGPSESLKANPGLVYLLVPLALTSRLSARCHSSPAIKPFAIHTTTNTKQPPLHPLLRLRSPTSTSRSACHPTRSI